MGHCLRACTRSFLRRTLLSDCLSPLRPQTLLGTEPAAGAAVPAAPLDRPASVLLVTSRFSVSVLFGSPRSADELKRRVKAFMEESSSR